MTEMTLPPLHALEPAPRRNGFRVAPPGWRGPAHAEAPAFHIDADQLWRTWMDFAARQPRTVLQSRHEHDRRSLHVQRSAFFRFPDLVRAEVVPLGTQRSGLVLDSRSRFGWWDLGVNRHRVMRWLKELQHVITADRAK
jgi:uncharacterized protein (DUF1499 family)